MRICFFRGKIPLIGEGVEIIDNMFILLFQDRAKIDVTVAFLLEGKSVFH